MNEEYVAPRRQRTPPAGARDGGVAPREHRDGPAGTFLLLQALRQEMEAKAMADLVTLRAPARGGGRRADGWVTTLTCLQDAWSSSCWLAVAFFW